MTVMRVGTRKSALARTQTGHVIEALRFAYPEVTFEVREIVTKGDRIQDVALSKVGGKGLFISELEDAIVRGEVDFAVHSMKDVPALLADGLIIAAVPRRADARDLLISEHGYSLTDLPIGSTVGTSSLRRSAQLSRWRRDLRIEPLRGNIDTRLRRTAQRTDFAAIVLAAAGLARMDWWDPQSGAVKDYDLKARPLAISEMIPAVGQGALCIECRATDESVRQLLSCLHDADTAECAQTERAFLTAVGGSCQVPIAAYAKIVRDQTAAVRQISLQALIGAPDGSVTVEETAIGDDPQEVGRALGDRLLSAGGRAILASLS